MFEFLERIIFDLSYLAVIAFCSIWVLQWSKDLFAAKSKAAVVKSIAILVLSVVGGLLYSHFKFENIRFCWFFAYILLAFSQCGYEYFIQMKYIKVIAKAFLKKCGLDISVAPETK